jgi:hypothetical protein
LTQVEIEPRREKVPADAANTHGYFFIATPARRPVLIGQGKLTHHPDEASDLSKIFDRHSGFAFFQTWLHSSRSF